MKTLRRIRFISGTILIGMVVTYALWMGFSFYIKDRITKELLKEHLHCESIGDIRPSREGILIKDLYVTHLQDCCHFSIGEAIFTVSFKSLLRKNYDSLHIRHMKIDVTTKAAFSMMSYLLSMHDTPHAISTGILKKGFLTSKKHKLEGVLCLHNVPSLKAKSQLSGHSDIDIPFDMTWVNDPHQPYPKIDAAFHVSGKAVRARGECAFGAEGLSEADSLSTSKDKEKNRHNFSSQALSYPKGFVLFKHITIDPTYVSSILNQSEILKVLSLKEWGGYIQSLRFSFDHAIFNDLKSAVEKNGLKMDGGPLFRGVKFYMDNAFLFERSSSKSRTAPSKKRPVPNLHDPFFIKGKLNLCAPNPLILPSQRSVNHGDYVLGGGKIMCGEKRAEFFLKQEKMGVAWTMNPLTLMVKSFQPIVSRLFTGDRYSVDGEVILGAKLFVPFDQSSPMLQIQDYHQSYLTRSLGNVGENEYSHLSWLNQKFLSEKTSGNLFLTFKNIHFSHLKKQPKETISHGPNFLSFIKNLSGQFSFALPSFKTTKVQECQVDEIGLLLGQECVLKHLNIQWDYDSFFHLKRIQGEGMGGLIHLHSFLQTESGTVFYADLKDIALQSLFNHLALKDIKGEGVLEGQAKGIFEKYQGVVITDAKLFSSSTNGALTYNGLLNLEKKPITTPTLFTMLTLSLVKKNDQTHVIFDVLGRNQGFQDGTPHRFSIQTKI